MRTVLHVAAYVYVSGWAVNFFRSALEERKIVDGEGMLNLAPCSFEHISRISSHPAIFFSHNKLANRTFSDNSPAKRTGG
jgi:hypothetical protein